MRKVRLYIRLVSLAFKVVGRRRGGNWASTQEIWSEAEAIHRDLGHGYHAELVLPQHRSPILGSGRSS